MFIVVEGVDGVGKTSVSKELVRILNAQYYKSPAPSLLDAKKVVDSSFDPISRYYFYRSIVQNDSMRISELLKRGHTVVCDRYTQSLYAYHVALDHRIEKLYEISDLLMPDFEILLVASTEVRRNRIRQREQAADLSTKMDLNDDFLVKVQEILKSRGMLTINTNDKPIDQIAAMIIAKIQKSSSDNPFGGF